MVEYTLNQLNQPTTVASYKLPQELQEQLPDEEEIISGISKLLQRGQTYDRRIQNLPTHSGATSRSQNPNRIFS